jgi:hypothetical protein
MNLNAVAPNKVVSSVNSSGLYPGGAAFEFVPGHRLTIRRTFTDLPQSQANHGAACSDRLFAQFQFIFIILTLGTQ